MLWLHSLIICFIPYRGQHHARLCERQEAFIGQDVGQKEPPIHSLRPGPGRHRFTINAGGCVSKDRGLKRNRRDDAAKEAIKRRENARKALELRRELEELLKRIS